jgi:hypothetical protein
MLFVTERTAEVHGKHEVRVPCLVVFSRRDSQPPERPGLRRRAAGICALGEVRLELPEVVQMLACPEQHERGLDGCLKERPKPHG